MRPMRRGMNVEQEMGICTPDNKQKSFARQDKQRSSLIMVKYLVPNLRFIQF